MKRSLNLTAARFAATIALLSVATGCVTDLGTDPGGDYTGEYTGGTIPEPTNGAATSWTPVGEALPDDGADAARPERRWKNVAVYFAYDRSTIAASERSKLEALANYLGQHPRVDLVIEGHADERGSDEYNRGLSERRALAVKRYLTDLGISTSRMETIPYGEDRPAVASATTDADHARNRRVEFVFLLPR